MQTLELKVYGVQEMNYQEMIEVEGGSWSAVWKALDYLGRLDVAAKIIKAVGNFDWEAYSQGRQEMILKDIENGVYVD